MLYLWVSVGSMTEALVKAWWNTLPKYLQNEWLAIDWAWKNSDGGDARFYANLSRDWIEEHGGDRLWWGTMHVYWSPDATNAKG